MIKWHAHYFGDMEFDTFRLIEGLEPDTAYEVGEGYAFSPDGEGIYWYKTLEELEENH